MSITAGGVSESPDIPTSVSIPSKDMSSFSQVVFPEISDYFPPGKDVQVKYVLTEALEPSSRDWIGLYQVGWTSAREYLTFVWAPKLDSADRDDRSVTATFTAYYLPKDTNEFYQFCYVTRQGNVRGASTPFQFRLPSECDQLVEVEDETGMILLKTRSAVMEEKVDCLTEEKAKLEERLKKLEEKVLKQQDDLSSSTSEIDRERQGKEKKEEECQRLKKEIAEIKKKLKDIAAKLNVAETTVGSQRKEIKSGVSQIAQLRKECGGLSEELSRAKTEAEDHVSSLNSQLDEKINKLAELESLVVELTESLELNRKQEVAQKSEAANVRDGAKAEAARYKEERDAFKNQLAHSVEARRGVEQQLMSTKEELKAMQTEILEKAEKLAGYDKRTRMLKASLRDAENQYAAQKSLTENHLRDVEDKLNASDASKRLITTELTETRDHRDSLMSELHQIKKERDLQSRDLEASRRQLSELEKNYVEMLDQAEKSKVMYEEREQEFNRKSANAKEREIALKEKIALLKSQLECADMAVAAATSKDEKNENSTQTIITSKSAEKQESAGANGGKDDTIAELQAQVKDLHTRLSIGAAVYAEKFKECQKLEKETGKMKHATPAGELSESSSARRKITSIVPQLLAAITDPSQGEKQRARKKRELERCVKLEHEKCEKYRQSYHSEQQSREKAAAEVLALKREVEEIKKDRDALKHENEALSEQVNEFVIKSHDASVVKTRTPKEIILPTPKFSTSSAYPHEGASSYPHDCLLFQSDTTTSSSDSSGEFQLARTRFTEAPTVGGKSPMIEVISNSASGASAKRGARRKRGKHRNGQSSKDFA